MENEAAREPAESQVSQEQTPQTEAVLAVVSPDDCPGASFDATPWLVAIDADELANLRSLSVGESYLSDELAQDMRGADERIDAILTYCETLGLGWSCVLPMQQTEHWLTRFRPSLVHTLARPFSPSENAEEASLLERHP